MIPGVNPRQMRQMMNRMGISQSEIEATQVIIRTKEGDLVFTQPEVSKMNIMGQETYQVVGKPALEQPSAEDSEVVSHDDIKTVMEHAHVSEEQARVAIEESSGDIAAAILKFKEVNE